MIERAKRIRVFKWSKYIVFLLYSLYYYWN